MFASVRVLMAAIQLVGVEGTDLRARAFFDANNVKVGDPLILTIDFLGNADFKDLHPPALAKVVGRKEWKLDDVSAKTDTFRDARRLTYRVRPMREGVLWFPALEFEYEGPDGTKRVTRSNEIPVHAKGGAQVNMDAEMSEETNEMPKPPELIADVRGRDALAPKAGNEGGGDVPSPLSEDELFRWRKALAKPTADAFVKFDFPEARMNEATCAIREGNWARAMKVYSALEWRIGQTPEIERGIVAALALKVDNPAVELPVVRQVLRPILRYGWQGRVGIVGGALAALALLFWLLGRLIRAVACVAVACAFATAASAETVETVTTNADGSVTHRRVTTGGNGSFSFSFTSSSSSGGMPRPAAGLKGGRGIEPFSLFEEWDPFGMNRPRVKRPPVQVTVRLEPDKPVVSVGEDFDLVLSIDQPRYISFSDGVRLSIAEQGKMQQTGAGQALRSVKSKNPTNVVQRLVFPMRANEPFTNLHFSVEGEYVFANDHPFFRQEAPFMSGTRHARLTVRPLPAEGCPDDFGGIVAHGVSLFETCDLLRVHTNDVVTITYRLRPQGYVPASFLPRDVAFEWTRQNDRSGQLAEIEYRRYFVADGTPKSPRFSVSYYDPRKQAYQTVSVGGTALKYVPDDE